MSVCVFCGQAWHPSEGEDKERNEEGIIQPLPLSTAQVFCWNICVANDCFEIFDPSPWRFPVQLPLLLMFNVFYFPFVADFSLMSTNWFANCNWWPGSRSRSLAPWRPRSFFFSSLQWSRTVWLVHHQHSLLPPRHPLGHLLAHQQVWLCQIFQFRTLKTVFTFHNSGLMIRMVQQLYCFEI